MKSHASHWRGTALSSKYSARLDCGGRIRAPRFMASMVLPIVATSALLLLAISCAPDVSSPRPLVVKGRICEGKELATWTAAEAQKVDAERSCRPIANADIRLSSADGERLVVHSNESGRFQVGPLSVGGRKQDRIIFHEKDHAALSISSLSAPSGQHEPMIIRVELPPKQCAVQGSASSAGK